jgi:ribosomal protein S13
MDFLLIVDKILPFLKKKNSLDLLMNLNLFQFYLQRFGIGKIISKKILFFSGVHCSVKIKSYNVNVINQKSKWLFKKSENFLDIPLERYMIKSIQLNIDLYNYRGNCYLLRFPLNGQRRRANARTVRRVRPIHV